MMRFLLSGFIFLLLITLPKIPVQAREYLTGKLIVGQTSPAVYYVQNDGTRLAFPTSDIFFTWYDDFNNVIRISDTELGSIPYAGVVKARPGVKMIKIQSDPKTYAISAGGILHWIENEDVARALYSYDWNQKIIDIPVSFFSSYSIGESVSTATEYSVDEQLRHVISIDDNVYMIQIPDQAIPVPEEPTPIPTEPTTVTEFNYVPHSASGIYQFTNYAEPERRLISAGDIIQLNNNLIIEVTQASAGSTGLKLYYDTQPRLYYPKSFATLRTDGSKDNPPYFARDGIYLYLNGYRSEIGKSEVEIYTTPKDLYRRCLSDYRNSKKQCLLDIGRYAPVHASYDDIWNGRFHVVFPDEIREAAEQTLAYLPGCYNALKSAFTVDQAIGNVTVFFYYPDMQDEGLYAVEDALIVPFYPFRMRLLDQKNNQACGVGFFPMSHELGHIFEYNTQNTPLLREGLVSYLSRQFDEFNTELDCTATGYRKHYLYNDTYSAVTRYPSDSSYDEYNVGECYFNRLRQSFGSLKVNEIIAYLGRTRNYQSSGDVGIYGNVNFFEDVIKPIVGQRGVDMAREMHIDTTCDYFIPFDGYLCAE